MRRARPRSIDSARRRLPGANLALISVPGAFAAAEALKALKLGMHAMLFSDNVSLGDEVRLKRLAADKGLLLMGPDCGTAYLNGVPLGFANAVPRGRVGVVAASGTGLQQVAALLAAGGEGISQAVGVGGRDATEEVGGLMTLQALDALAADPGTELDRGDSQAGSAGGARARGRPAPGHRQARGPRHARRGRRRRRRRKRGDRPHARGRRPGRARHPPGAALGAASVPPRPSGRGEADRGREAGAPAGPARDPGTLRGRDARPRGRS